MMRESGRRSRRSCCSAPCWPRPARQPVSQTSRSAPYDDASCAVSCGQLRSVVVSCGQLRSVVSRPRRSCCLARCWPRPARRPVSPTSRSAPYDDVSCAVSCGQLWSVAVSCQSSLTGDPAARLPAGQGRPGDRWVRHHALPRTTMLPVRSVAVSCGQLRSVAVSCRSSLTGDPAAWLAAGQGRPGDRWVRHHALPRTTMLPMRSVAVSCGQLLVVLWGQLRSVALCPARRRVLLRCFLSGQLRSVDACVVSGETRSLAVLSQQRNSVYRRDGGLTHL